MSPTIYAFFRRLFWLLGRLIFRLRIFGRENLPLQGAVLLVANHASFIDPPLLGCGLPRPVHYLARSNLNHIPLFAWVLRRLGVLFVQRDGGARAGLELGMGALVAGEVLGMFPEGTRSRDGEIGSFKRGLLLMLKRLQERGVDVVVLPAGIRGTYRAWPRGRWFPLPSRCEVHLGQVMTSGEVLADSDLQCLRRQVSILSGKDPGQEGGSTPVRSAVPGASQPPKQTPAGQNSYLSLAASSLAVEGCGSGPAFRRMFVSLEAEVPSLVCSATLLPGCEHGISSSPA